MSAGLVLSASNIRVRRAGGFSLHVDHLTLSRGEVLALLGPNGAGKSTLLQTLALLEPPQSGAIHLDGADVSRDRRGARRRMAVVLQEPLLLRGSVRENVALGLRLRGLARDERTARADRWMQRTGIAHLAGRTARSLSGGEQRRVSLARALVLEPLVLFLDEPFAALDAPSRRGLIGDLPGWLNDAGCAAVLVTHDRDEALQLADRVAIIMSGAIRQSGPVDHVFQHPVDADVAGFLGIENVLEAEVDGPAGATATRIRIEGVELTVAGAHAPGAARATLHPERVMLVAADQPAGEMWNRLPARVLSVAPAGSQWRVTLDAGFRLTALIPRAAADDLPLEPGAVLTATIRTTAIHLIRPAAGGTPARTAGLPADR